MEIRLNKLAAKIDQAIDDRNLNDLIQYLEKIELLKAKENSKLDIAHLHFFSANCYSAMRSLKKDINDWAWENSNLEKEIYYLRLAFSECNEVLFEQDLSDLRFRIGTNLANALNHVGRSVEAIEIWDNVINSCPKFSMAIGNRGYCLSWYANYLYDLGHQPLFFYESYIAIKKALEIGVEPHAAKEMEVWLEHLEEITNWDKFNFKPKPESKGRSKLERKYRNWCLQNRLFLNPLNDILKDDFVANDVLTFPSVRVSVEKSSPSPPEVYGIYNQLKQEYVSARYMLFEAIEDSEKNIHFSDKRVLLYDMLDYRYYRLWIEKLKMSFLSTYTIFDKIGYLINEYWELNLSVQKIKFNTVWFDKADKRRCLHERFKLSDNWPLRGLFWVSKDLYFLNDDEQTIEPDARHLNHIRNHIAHKYLKVYDDVLVDVKSMRNRKGYKLSYPISEIELKNQTLKLLKLVRSALIYVSLAAHSEESKLKDESEGGFVGEMPLFEVGDKYRL